MYSNNNVNGMSNLNTKCLTDDYISHRLSRAGYSWRNGPAAPEHPGRLKHCLRALGDEFEERYSESFTEMCNHIHITPSTGQRTFQGIVGELFSDGVKWGRVVALFAFSGALAVQSVDKGLEYMVDDISVWVAQYIDNNLAGWIAQHGGWEGFLKFYETGTEKEREWSWPTLCGIASAAAVGAVGVLTLGALYTPKSS